MSDMKDAGKAIGSLMGGLFKKKKTDEPQDAAGAAPPAGTLAQRTLRALLATPGVDVVLAGMRRPAYVEDVVRAWA